MINEIINLLPSADLKAKIAEINHSFSEGELLQIIYRYAPSFDRRLSLLERFSRIACDDVSAQAKVYIEYERTYFKRFKEACEGFVYELCIKESPDSHEETYLCSSYDSALLGIDRFYEKYSRVAKETDQTRYKIVKRKIFSESEIFDEDVYAECLLGKNKTVLKVLDYNKNIDCESETMCSECTDICPLRCDDIYFPCFASNHDIIKYRDNNGKERFGVYWDTDNECESMATELYVIHLDSFVIRERMFDDAVCVHDHIELPCATVALPEELDETMRKD